MSRLIDADEIRKYIIGIDPYNREFVGRVKYALQLVPTVDAVEVVRCKECRHRHDGDCPISWGKTDEDFCSFAER